MQNNTINKDRKQLKSYSSQSIRHTRKVYLLVNIFIIFNISVVPIVFFASNRINQNIGAQQSTKIWEQGYENGFTGWGGTNQGTLGTYQKNTATSPVREGSKSGRFEVRDGDCPLTGNCSTDYGERSEVQGSVSNTGGYEGDVRWYKWSTYFAAPFDTSKGFQTFSQWHDNGPGSPPVAFYAEGGKIHLVANINYGGGNISYGNTMWSTNIQTNKWYDIKMRILWSGDDTKGQVSLWIDGSAVNLVKSTSRITSCSGNTCTVRTLRPGSSTYYKQGLYRSVNYTSTSVIYHDGFTSASSETGLGGNVISPPSGGGSSDGGTNGGGTVTPPADNNNSGGTTTPPEASNDGVVSGGDVNSGSGTVPQGAEQSFIPHQGSEADKNNEKIALDSASEMVYDSEGNTVPLNQGSADDVSQTQNSSDDQDLKPVGTAIAGFVKTGKIDKNNGVNILKHLVIIFSVIAIVSVLGLLAYTKLSFFEAFRANMKMR